MYICIYLYNKLPRISTRVSSFSSFLVLGTRTVQNALRTAQNALRTVQNRSQRTQNRSEALGARSEPLRTP